MSVPDLVVFDIAGTTIHATDQVPAAFRKTFANIDIELSDDEIQAVRGRSKREAIAELLMRNDARSDPQAIYDDFRRILTNSYDAGGTQPIDGADETFDWLRTRDVKIALNTGFDRNVAERLVRAVGWENRFDAVVCNDDVPCGRPAPYLLFRAMEWTACKRVRRVAAVGDTVSDLEAAWNAGVGWSIGVLSGAHSANQLADCAHTAIIPSVADLPTVFEPKD